MADKRLPVVMEPALEEAMRTTIVGVAACLAVLVLAGCKSGPSNIAPDRFDYTAAIAQSNNEQLLSNIVRLRYSETPVFLGVGSVLTQYVYSGRIGAEGALASDDTAAVPGWTVGGSVSGLYIERPTITYTPLVGQDFTQQLLAPVDAAAVFSLVQSGWSPEELMVLTMEGINDIDGRVRSPRPSEQALAELRRFHEVVDLLLRIAAHKGVEMQRDAGQPAQRYLVFDEDADAETQALIDELKDALELDAGRSKFRVTDRDIRGPDEITLRVRSLGAMLGLESRGIDVPPEHLAAQKAVAMTRPEEVAELASLVRLRVRSQADRPDDAYVAVQHEGFWFYIPDDDHQSKQTFGLLGYLFQVQAPAAQSVGGPVLTVPTG